MDVRRNLLDNEITFCNWDQVGRHFGWRKSVCCSSPWRSMVSSIGMTLVHCFRVV